MRVCGKNCSESFRLIGNSRFIGTAVLERDRSMSVASGFVSVVAAVAVATVIPATVAAAVSIAVAVAVAVTSVDILYPKIDNPTLDSKKATRRQEDARINPYCKASYISEQ